MGNVARLTAVLLAVALGLSPGGAYAKRVFIDSIDDPNWFALSGQQWSWHHVVAPASNSVLEVLVPFKLKFGSAPKTNYYACVSENGFVRFTKVSIGHCPQSLPFGPLVDDGNYIASDYSDLANARLDPDELDGAALASVGVYDAAAPFDLEEASEAIGFTWYDMPYVDRPGIYAGQVILTNRENGNFDLEFNFGEAGGGAIYWPLGVQGFRLGPNVIYRPAGEPINTNVIFCFRGGVASTGCSS